MITKITLLFIILNLIILSFKKKLTLNYNVYDLPNKKRKIHKYKTPLIGGLIFYINFFFFFIISIFDKEILDSVLIIFTNKSNYYLFFVTSTLVFIVGYFDDKKDLKANFKLLLLTVIILILLYFEKSLRIEIINFSFSEKIFTFHQFEFLFTLFCFLAFINAFNLFDGINLQVGIYSSYIFIILYYLSGNVLILSFFFPLLIFLVLNFKGKIFLGNSGSYFLSFIISIFFVYFFKNFQNITSDQILAIMFIPGLDMVRLFIFRIFKKRSPFSADKNHIHHKFLVIFGYEKTIFILFIFMIMPLGIVSILDNKFSLFYALLIYTISILKIKNLKK